MGDVPLWYISVPRRETIRNELFHWNSLKCFLKKQLRHMANLRCFATKHSIEACYGMKLRILADLRWAE